MTGERTTMLGEKAYAQVTESIQGLLDLTSRVDERVKLMMQKQEVVEGKIDNLLIGYNELKTKVSVLESRETPEELGSNINNLKDDVHNMQLKMQIIEAEHEKPIHAIELRLQKLEDGAIRSQNVWSKLIDNAFKLGFVILAAYLLYKLGIQAPNVP
jgi:hypothetical protein